MRVTEMGERERGGEREWRNRELKAGPAGQGDREMEKEETRKREREKRGTQERPTSRG